MLQRKKIAMKTYELDSSALDMHLVSTSEGKAIIGRFWLVVVIDTYSRAIVSCRIVPEPICATTTQEPPSPCLPEAVMINQAVLE